MRHLFLCLAAAAAVTPVAAAALTAVTGGAIGSGSAPIASCDADGFAATYVTSGLSVTAVTVSGIADPGCEGGVLQIRVTDATGASIAAGAPQTIAADGDVLDNTETVTVAPQPAATTAMRIKLVVEGP